MENLPKPPVAGTVKEVDAPEVTSSENHGDATPDTKDVDRSPTQAHVADGKSPNGKPKRQTADLDAENKKLRRELNSLRKRMTKSQRTVTITLSALNHLGRSEMVSYDVQEFCRATIARVERVKAGLADHPGPGQACVIVPHEPNSTNILSSVQLGFGPSTQIGRVMPPWQTFVVPPNPQSRNRRVRRARRGRAGENGDLPAKPSREATAAEAANLDQAESVRSSMRAAKTKSEMSKAIEQGKVLGLSHEVAIATKNLAMLPGD